MSPALGDEHAGRPIAPGQSTREAEEAHTSRRGFRQRQDQLPASVPAGEIDGDATAAGEVAQATRQPARGQRGQQVEDAGTRVDEHLAERGHEAEAGLGTPTEHSTQTSKLLQIKSLNV